MSAATTSEPKLLSRPRAASAISLTVLSFARGVSSARPPRMPFGSSITTAISSSPIQKYQYCGLRPEN